MTIKSPDWGNEVANNFQRKANQHWELAALAHKSGDKAEEEHNTRWARYFDGLAADAASSKDETDGS